MRTDQRDAPLDLLLARLGERRHQLLVQVLARVRPHRAPTACTPGRGGRRPGPAARTPCPASGCSGRDQVETLGEQLGACAARRCWSQTSSVEPGPAARPAVPARPSAAGLQQGVALLEDPVVVGAHPGHPRRAGGDQLVQETAPLTGVALDQREILRREQHGAHDAEHVTRFDLRGPVDPGAVGLARVQLQLDQLLPLALPDLGPDHGPLGAHARPAARRRRPGGCRGWRGSRPPRPGSSCPARWGRRTR